MELSIIIVSWNVRDALAACLTSIIEHTRGLNYEIIVVDNASEDATVSMIKNFFPNVRLLQNALNVGFGRGNNKAVEIAQGEFLFFLNPDCVLRENSAKILIEKLRADITVGIISCKLFSPDGTAQPSVRGYPHLTDQAMILTRIAHFFPNAAPMRRYLASEISYDHEQDVEQVMGAVMAIRKDFFLKAHGFDEQFFLFFEEVDLQRRLAEKYGKRTMYTPETSVTHTKSSSFRQCSAVTNHRHFYQSICHYFRKHEGRVATWCLRLIAPLSFFIAGCTDLAAKLHFDLSSLRHGKH